MSARRRLLFQAALVSAVVGSASAALVSRCGATDEAETHTFSTTTTTTTSSASDADAASLGALPRTSPSPSPSPSPRAVEPSSPRETPPTSPADGLPVAADGEAIAAEGAPGPLGLQDGAAPGARAEPDAGASGAPVSAQLEADAGARLAEVYDRLFGPPSFAAGAGRFALEPSPWAASAYAPPENAGAGAFTLAPPPFGASAYTPPENAGAGAFTTDRSSPGGGGVSPLLPYLPFLLGLPLPPEADVAPAPP